MQKSLTVFIPDDLHMQVKIAAATAGQSIREFVTSSLAAAVQPAGDSKHGKTESKGNIAPQTEAPQKPRKQASRKAR